MRIKNIQLYSYKLPFRIPLQLKGHTHTHREGVIIQLTSEQNIDGFGEIAPLPMFSEESIDEAVRQAEKLEAYLKGEDLPDGLAKLDGSFDGWLGGLKLKPSVQFGIEMAVLNLLANSQDMTLSHLLSEEIHDHISVNGLLLGSIDEVTQQAEKLKTEGFKSLKLKVGNNINEDVAKVKAVNKVLDGKAILHLDANQSWDVETAIEFGNKIGCAAVDYIEEPFKQPDKIPQFFDSTLIPVALDETVINMDIKEIQSIEGVDFIVLKPTLIGGVERTWEKIKAAKRQAIEVIISSAFESSIGILTLANLAGSYTTRDRNAGLDTVKWFESDLLKEKITFENGTINISSRKITANDIDFSKLTLIE